jgi:transcriptional regulator with XRE-family HTH domain
MSIVERFAANLRRTRIARGLTQEGLGDVADLHRTHISLLEKARRDPRITTVAKLADGLDTTPEQLLAEPDAPSSETADAEPGGADATPQSD